MKQIQSSCNDYREVEKRDREDASRPASLSVQCYRICGRWLSRASTTIEIDRAAEKMIRDAGALPTFKGYNGFPYSICASVNEQVVHGFPSDYKLKEGDIFSIDCGATLEGFVGDTATTVPVGKVDEERLKLIRITEECLDLAIEQCRAGNHLGDIGWAVQQHAEANGYSVVRDYVGHGIGRRMHEDPQIPNYGKPGLGPKDQGGLRLCGRADGEHGNPFHQGIG